MQTKKLSSYQMIAALAFALMGLLHLVQFILHLEFKFDVQELAFCVLYIGTGFLLFRSQRSQLLTVALVAVSVFGFATTSIRFAEALAFLILAIIYGNIVKKEKRGEAPDRTGTETTWLIYAILLTLPSLMDFLGKLFSMKTWNNNNEPFLLAVIFAQTVAVLTTVLYAAFPAGGMGKRAKKDK